MAAENLPIEVCCRVLQVSPSVFYEWRGRPPSPRALRHVWVTDQIREVHAALHGTYGIARVHAELRFARGILVGHNAVEMLMRRAGLLACPVPGDLGPSTRHPLPMTWSTATSPDRSPTSCGSPT
jgi:putative transposase